jgi:2-haloacid dehalogenase
MLFDTFGTVVDWREGIAKGVSDFFRRYGLKGDPHAFADAWRGRYQDSMEPIRLGLRPFTRLDVPLEQGFDVRITAAGRPSL